MKETLTRKLELMMEAKRDEENLAEIVDTKIQLIWEIDKDEMY